MDIKKCELCKYDYDDIQPPICVECHSYSNFEKKEWWKGLTKEQLYKKLLKDLEDLYDFDLLSTYQVSIAEVIDAVKVLFGEE